MAWRCFGFCRWGFRPPHSVEVQAVDELHLDPSNLVDGGTAERGFELPGRFLFWSG